MAWPLNWRSVHPRPPFSAQWPWFFLANSYTLLTNNFKIKGSSTNTLIICSFIHWLSPLLWKYFYGAATPKRLEIMLPVKNHNGKRKNLPTYHSNILSYCMPVNFSCLLCPVFCLTHACILTPSLWEKKLSPSLSLIAQFMQDFCVQ